MIPPVQRQMFTDKALSQFQDQVLAALSIVFNLPFLRGAQSSIGPLSAAGTFNVTHRLARKPTGFLVLDLRRAAGATGAAGIYRREGDTLDAERLQLYSATAFDSLTVWVF